MMSSPLEKKEVWEVLSNVWGEIALHLSDMCEARIGGNSKLGCTFSFSEALTMADTWHDPKVGFCSLGFPDSSLCILEKFFEAQNWFKVISIFDLCFKVKHWKFLIFLAFSTCAFDLE